MVFTMANIQRIAISVLLILTATFLFLAQSAEAVRGPKITSKVSSMLGRPRHDIDDFLGLLRHQARR